MADGKQEQLYLMSSNTTQKYALDAWETIASPHGFVQHFRYRLRWLGDELRATILTSNDSGLSTLLGASVIVSYLYQVRRGEMTEWHCVYPVRSATIVDVHCTGSSDNDVVHFYFKVGNYISYDGNPDYDSFMRSVLGAKFGNCYACLGDAFAADYIANEDDSRQAFRSICESLKADHLQTLEGKKFSPVYSLVQGIKQKDGKLLTPSYDKSSHRTYYKLKEGTRYTFEFSLHFPRPSREFTFSLECENKVFSSPARYELKVSSQYDEESWLLVSRIIDNNTWSSVAFRSDLGSEHDIPLNVNLMFPIMLHRKMMYRLVEVIGDIAFGIGTLSLALRAGMTTWDWWGWPVAFGYVVWIISKIVIKFWRG